MSFAAGGLSAGISSAVLLGVVVIAAIFIGIVERRRMKNARKAVKDVQTEADKILANAQTQANQVTARAEQQSASIIRDAQSRAKEVVAAAKEDFEQSVAERRNEVRKAEERVAQREEHFESRLSKLQERLNDLDKREETLKCQSEALAAKKSELEAALADQMNQLHRISGLSPDEARKEVLERLENSMTQERGVLIRRFQEESRQQLADEGRKVMIDAMQRYAGDCTYERTTAVIPLPNEEMKGRIIGREGRNIRSLENATGVSILVDDTPQAVVISCFDPVRREIARQVMEKMVTDGRIHPGRVEELVAKIRKEVENDIQKTGQETVEKLGVLHLRPNLISLLGRLKFRYSFSQNVLAHSIEVASMMGAIAASVGLDEHKARRAGLLHDIGKAVDHEVEGSHASIGADLLRRAGEDEEIINAVAAHHEECEKTSLMAVLVQICDAVSAGRPGARSETTELYLKRLEDLERIGRTFEGVEECYAIQAGRELRVVVKPEKVSEEQAAVIAREMAERIEKEMRYPGQIRISIIRETRAVEYAK